MMVVNMEKHMKHTDTLCRQKAEFPNVSEGGIYSYHCVLNCHDYDDRKLYVTTNDRI
jgi:hypothetical protein